MQPGLIPPNGIWRGATISGENEYKGWYYGDVKRAFEDYWNQPLHIYRSFNTHSNADIRETDFIERGGILFYSIQPAVWAEYAEDGIRNAEIELYARSIKAVSPH